MAEEEHSPSPPLSQSQSLNATSSQWELPSQPDLLANFQYSKPVPAGLVSGGKTPAGASHSATNSEGSSTSQKGAEGGAGGDYGSPQGATREKSGEAGKSSAQGVEGVEVSSRSATGAGKLGQDKTDQAAPFNTGEKTKEPGASQPAAPSFFAERFRMGQQGVGAFPAVHNKPHHSAFTPRPSAVVDLFSSPGNAARADSASAVGASRLPPPSQITPQRSQNQLQGTISRIANTTSTPRSPAAHGATSRSASHSHTSEGRQSQQPPPRRTSAPLSPHLGQLQARQQQENVQPGARQGPASDGALGNSSSKKRGPPAATSVDGAVARAGSKEVTGGGVPKGVGGAARSRDRSPSAKRRKSEKGDKTGPMPMEDIIAGIASYKSQAERRESEIVALRAQLSDKEKSLERIQAANDTLKREAMGKVNLALSRLEGARKELSDTTVGMRAATSKLESEKGTLGGVRELREELNSVQELFGGRFFADDGQPWLERNEEARVAALRTLQTEIQQRQDVIALLREQLATKTGEIVEARDRISLLEQGQASQARNLLEIEQVRKASSAREEELQQKRLEMEKRLDEVLLKSREREEALEEELRSTRKVAEDVRLSLTSVEASNSSLITSNSRLEKEVCDHQSTLEDLQTKFKTLEISKLDLQASFDTFRTESRAEKDGLQHELRKSKAQVEEQSGALARQLAELDQLRPLSSQLSKVKLDFKLLEKKLATEGGAAAESLERERSVSRDLKSRNEALLSQLKSKEEQLAEEGKRLSISKATVVSLEGSLSSLQAREKDVTTKSEEVATHLRIAQAEVLALRQQQQTSSTTQGAQTEGIRFEELKGLQLQIANLGAANDALSREKASLSQQIAQLGETITNLKSEKQSLSESQGAALAEVRRLEEELAKAVAARDSLLHLEGEISDLKRDQAVMLQKRAKETYESCQESHVREKVQLSNELKRANNRVEELQKRVGKLSTELAKSKNRPMIDPHVASSSPVSPAQGQQQQQLEQPEQPARAESPQQAPVSDDSSSHTLATTLSAIDAMEDGADDEIQVFTVEESPKRVNIKEKETPQEPEGPIGVPVVVPVPATVKKEKSKTAASNVKAKGDDAPPTRAQRTTRRRTMEPQPREGDEDEIEDIATQEVGSRGKNRPGAKTTYASKKRKDVKRD